MKAGGGRQGERWEPGDINLEVTCEAGKATGIHREQSSTFFVFSTPP